MRFRQDARTISSKLKVSICICLYDELIQVRVYLYVYIYIDTEVERKNKEINTERKQERKVYIDRHMDKSKRIIEPYRRKP